MLRLAEAVAALVVLVPRWRRDDLHMALRMANGVGRLALAAAADDRVSLRALLLDAIDHASVDVVLLRRPGRADQLPAGGLAGERLDPIDGDGLFAEVLRVVGSVPPSGFPGPALRFTLHDHGGCGALS